MLLYRNSRGLLPEKGSNSRISSGVVVWLLFVPLLAGSIHLMLKWYQVTICAGNLLAR